MVGIIEKQAEETVTVRARSRIKQEVDILVYFIYWFEYIDLRSNTSTKER